MGKVNYLPNYQLKVHNTTVLIKCTNMRYAEKKDHSQPDCYPTAKLQAGLLRNGIKDEPPRCQVLCIPTLA